MIIIINDNKAYVDSTIYFKYDYQSPIIGPIEGSTEFEYISGYGTRNFNRGDMISFNDQARPELDEIIDNIDNLIERKAARVQNYPDYLWEIPADMRDYAPPKEEGN